MYKRLAFFEGAILDGQHAAFDGYIAEHLLPLWRQFPGVTRVEILREVEAEDGSHRYPLVLQTTYPDREAIAVALASQVRFDSREMTRGLLALFSGRVFHVVYRLEDYAIA